MLWLHGNPKLERDSRNPDGHLWNRSTASGDDAGKATQQTKPENRIQEGNKSGDVVFTQKTMPFNNLIDQNSIAEQADDWLYPEPDFLDFVPQSYAKLWLMYGKKHFVDNIQEPAVAERALVEPLDTAYQSLLNRLQIILQNVAEDIQTMKLSVGVETVLEKAWLSLSEGNLEENSHFDITRQIIRDVQTIFKHSMPADDPQSLEQIIHGLEMLLIELAGSPAKAVPTMRFIIAKCREMAESNQAEERNLPLESPLSRAIPPNATEEYPPNAESSKSRAKGTIVDLRRFQKTKSKKGPQDRPLANVLMMTNQEIRKVLAMRRLSTEAENPFSSRSSRIDVKKRFVWLPHADVTTARICCLSTPFSERENTLAFFERHANHEEYFFDNTNAVQNTWKTELQLSFYQLHDQGSTISGIPMPKIVDFPKRRPIKEQKQRADIKPEHYQQISRATIGFEFNGDFFDRYWTCHFIEYKHKSRKPISDETEHYNMLQSQKYLLKSEGHKQPWRQRRVLELILFDRILEEITRAAEEIMN